LAKLLPLVIGLFAKLIGLGGLSKRVMKIFKKIRKRVDKAVNKLLKKAKKAGRKLMRKLGIGKKKKKGKKPEEDKRTDDGNDEQFDLFGKLRKYNKAKINQGKGHKLKFEDEGNLVVRSKPRPLNPLLKQKQEEIHAAKNTDPKYGEKQQALNRLKEEKGTFGKALGKYKGKQKKDYSANVEADYELIKESLIRMAADLTIIGIDTTGTTLEPTKVTHSVDSQGRASHVLAKPLTKIPGNTRGSSPGSSVPFGWEKIDPDQRAKYWVRAHMLNHHLHGPGKPWNLFPAEKTVNSQMEHQVEGPAKTAVHKGDATYYYEANVSYSGDFPSSAVVVFGSYHPEGGAETKIAEFNESLSAPPTYTVKLNVDSASRLNEVAKASNVKGMSTFFINLVKERNLNGGFDNEFEIESRMSNAKQSHINNLTTLIDSKVISVK
jgi:hypothetical protein